MPASINTPEGRTVGQPSTGAEAYNYPRFHPRVLGDDMRLIRHPEHPGLGSPAADFTLRDTEGQQWTLSELRGRPVVLVIGSGTCPLTQGNLPGLQGLYEEFKDRSTWLMLYVREAHPGENMPAHRDYEQKREQAAYFKREAGVQWPVLVDELDGSVHKSFGLLPNSTFLIDADGNVSFIGEITHAPTLRRALDHLFDQGMRGPVPEGDDKSAHMLGPTVYGWEALRRGGSQSVRDVASRMPPLAMNLWLGSKMKPLLGSVASRSRPLERGKKLALATGALAAAGAALYALTRRR